MKREIKFRAWDGYRKEMYDDKQVCRDINSCFYVWVRDGELLDEIVLMQYTGLKDKNGKEIYFGDILQTSSADPDTDMWKPEDYGYTVCKEDPDQLGVNFENWYPTNEEDSIFNRKYVEIIGNIYENPELLNNN